MVAAVPDAVWSHEVAGADEADPFAFVFGAKLRLEEMCTRRHLHTQTVNTRNTQ